MEYRVKNTIEQFKDLNILVVGDAMLDSYFKGYSERLCREAPVPIVSVQHEQNLPGGAANAAVNVAQLGANCYFFSVIGDDTEGRILTQTLEKHGIYTDTILQDSTRTTIAKKRIFAGSQLIVRYDIGSTQEITGRIEERLIDQLVDMYEKMDAVIISDYGYGILTADVCTTIKKLRQSFPIPLIVDSKHLDIYRDLQPSLVKPNFQEAVALLGITNPARRGNRIEQMQQYREKLLESTGAETVAVTLDTEGALIFGRSGESYRTYAKPVENSYAVGAGDTYISTFTLALAADAHIDEAAELAAAATAVVVHKEDTAYCSSSELQEIFSREETKIVKSRKQLQNLIEHYKKEGKRIVFTNGCFDILHSGHVNYLNQAKSLGDILIVGVNSDESVKRLKGPTRPINSVEDRMNVLTGLSSVDHIIAFTEDTPVELIKVVKPNIFVKGGDYTIETLPEAPLVKQLGGRIELIPYVKDRSTSSIISKITNTYNSFTKL